MKIRNNILTVIFTFIMTFFIGLTVNDMSVEAAIKVEHYYLQGNESLSLDVSKIKKPVLDWANMNKSDGSVKFGYKKGDSTKYLTLSTDSSKTKKIQACNVYGSYTFYINKNGDTNNDNRVRQITIHIYKIPSNNSTTGLTNSTSSTNGSYANVPVYLYKGQTSVLYNNHYDTWGPWSMTDTAGKGATIYVSGRNSSNTSVATIAAYGSNHIVTAGNTAGSSNIRVTISWKSSNGTQHLTYRDITVYVYDKPTFAIYKVNDSGETLCTGNQHFTWLDYGGMTHSYKYTYKATYPSGMSLASVSCTTPDSNTLGISRNGTYTTFTPKSHYTNQLITFKFVVNSPVRTHNGDNYSSFQLSYYTSFMESKDSYATGLKFDNKSVTTSLKNKYIQKATIIPANALNSMVYYSVDSEEIATVDRLTGEVTPKKCGKVKVYGESATNEKVKDFYTITVTANAPEEVNVSKSNSGNILNWRAVDQAKSYEVYRSTIIDGEYEKIGSTSVLFYEDAKIEYGKEYFYKIKTVPNEGNAYASEYSNVVSAIKVLDTPKINKISDGKQIKISWTKIDGAAKYEIFRRKNKDSYKKIGESISNTYTDSAVSYKNTYSYVIKAVADNGYSTDYSEASSIKHTIKAAQVKKVKKIKDGFKLNITGDKYTGYAVYVGKSKKPKKLKVLVKSKKVSVRYKMKKNKKYYVRIRSYVKKGGKITYSSYSKAVRIK